MISTSKYDDIFVVTSVLGYTSKPLSYSSARSLYAPEERAAQTLNTLLSIRKHHSKKCKIIVAELGLDKKITVDVLGGSVDSIIYLGNNLLVRWACDSKYKGLGEAVGLLTASRYLKNKGAFYYKVSGRYCLTDKYNIMSWDRARFNFKGYNADISTRLYGFPDKLFSSWQKALFKAIPQLMLGNQIETALPKYLPRENINFVSSLGIEGRIAPDGCYVIE